MQTALFKKNVYHIYHYISIDTIQKYLRLCDYLIHKSTIKDDIKALILIYMEIEYIHNKSYDLYQ